MPGVLLTVSRPQLSAPHSINKTMRKDGSAPHTVSKDAKTFGATAKGKSRGKRPSHTRSVSAIVPQPPESKPEAKDKDVFDPKTILPHRKVQKSLSQLVEASAMTKSSPDGAFACIDGSTRSYQDSQVVVQPSQPSSQQEETPRPQTIPVPDDAQGPREQFTAHGILAYPTRAVFSDICYDFVSARRWCHHGSKCYRVHPLDRQRYIASAIEDSVRLSRMRNSQATSNTPAANPLSTSSPSQSQVPPAPIRVKLPQAKLVSGTGQPLGPLDQLQPPDQVAPSSDVHDWDAVVGLKKAPFHRDELSDTSSACDDRDHGTFDGQNNRHGRMKPRDRTTWSDSEGTSDESHTSFKTPHTSLELSQSSPPSQVDVGQASSRSSFTQDHKDPMPLSGEVCRKWLQGRCSRRDCRYLHKNAKTVARYPVSSRPAMDLIMRHLSNPSGIAQTLPPPTEDRPRVPPATLAPRETQSRPSPPPAAHSNGSKITPKQAHPRPQTMLRCIEAIHKRCTLGYGCPKIHLDLIYDGDEDPSKDATPHPRPPSNERCIKWTRNECELGYDCRFVHDDLEYDPEIRKLPTFHSTTIHEHIQLRFGPGFSVEELTTGFESSWFFMGNLPNHIPDSKIHILLKPFGEVRDLRRPHIATSSLILKVQMASPLEACKAIVGLHNTNFSNRKLELRSCTTSRPGVSSVKDTAVRIDWEAPHRAGYSGFDTEEEAKKAVEISRRTPYGDFQTAAAIHIGLPRTGRHTVRFTGLPANATVEGMEMFGHSQGVMWEKCNYTNSSPQETIAELRRLLKNWFHGSLVDVDVRPPPYRDGKMRAWAYFASAADAQAAAQQLHGRSFEWIGKTKIIARHIKTVTFSIALFKFRKVAPDVQEFANNVRSQGGGYSVSSVDKGNSFAVQICGQDIKVLVRLKTQLERILNGEVVVQNGEVAWDDYFSRPYGHQFLAQLEIEYTGAKIERDVSRRVIRLFGLAEKRSLVRERVLQKLAELRAQRIHSIRLDGRLIAVFVNGAFDELEKKVGSDNVMLDMWERVLRVRGDEQIFGVARETVDVIRTTHHIPRYGQLDNNIVECPVCFNAASAAVKLACGHSWCRSCIQNYLKAAIDRKYFPLTCLGDEAACTEHIPLDIAQNLLTPAEFESVFTASFNSYVQKRPDMFNFCPTPDCLQIYRSMPGGVFIQCPSCFVRICSRCKTDAHDGLTCDESSGGEGLLQEWIAMNDVKQCPKCNIAIEKAAGCNHMVCTVCQTHICWVCLKTFPEGAGIYGHMQNEHGSYGLGPITS